MNATAGKQVGSALSTTGGSAQISAYKQPSSSIQKRHNLSAKIHTRISSLLVMIRDDLDHGPPEFVCMSHVGKVFTDKYFNPLA